MNGPIAPLAGLIGKALPGLAGKAPSQGGQLGPGAATSPAIASARMAMEGGQRNMAQRQAARPPIQGARPQYSRGLKRDSQRTMRKG